MMVQLTIISRYRKLDYDGTAQFKLDRTRVWHELVSRSQTLTDKQGLTACGVSAHAVRVWATDIAKFVYVSTQSWVGDDWLKGTRHFYMFIEIKSTLHVPIFKWLSLW